MQTILGKSLIALAVLTTTAFAAETNAVAPAAPAPTPTVQPTVARVMVILPERIDQDWYWYYFTDETQHLVQSAVEKALVQAGVDLVDLASVDAFKEKVSLDQLTSPAGAVKKGAEAGATHVLVGRAAAIPGGESRAYGVPVVRATAEATAKLVRVSDGKVLLVEDASGNGGGQGQRLAGREALKDVADKLADKLATAVPKALSGK